MEAAPGFGPGMKDLQSSALPLGYAAATNESIATGGTSVKKFEILPEAVCLRQIHYRRRLNIIMFLLHGRVLLVHLRLSSSLSGLFRLPCF